MEAARRANHYKDPEPASGSLLGQWHLSTTLLLWASDRKAGWMLTATWMFVAAVASLLIPLAVALGRRFSC